MPYPENPRHHSPQAHAPGSGTTASDSLFAVAITSSAPGIPPGTAPDAWRVPCPRCRTIVVFPFDPVLNARLDRLLQVEDALRVTPADFRAVQELIKELLP
jgi:hypothetical protein